MSPFHTETVRLCLKDVAIDHERLLVRRGSNRVRDFLSSSGIPSGGGDASHLGRLVILRTTVPKIVFG
jgi:hypothetical protein